MGGIVIGSGAVIGAGAIVTKDVLPYEIVGGAPAKRIRYRFPIETVKELLKIAWWDWSEEKITENGELLMSNNILEFINKHKWQDKD